ncbi:MAG: mandelate racemase/muconate lactonizing enzyme family protein, partial [Nocardiopsaceae bacterium]|nr:mandelate racemase/muconate lactonizing enzyme family protein [Nocardiopsaceae bacterium]
ALWDIAGKVSGQPVATLFGGALQEVPCYASFGEARGPADRAEAVLAAMEAGFRAVKIRIPREDPAAGLASVRAAREAAGTDLAIMVDLNQWWRMPGDISVALDLAAVRRIADELRELGVFWLEEPLPGEDLEGMRALREQSRVRIAGGEMARTPADLYRALEAGSLDVVQPDVVLAVGMSRARSVAEAALLAGRWFTPHTWTNGLGLLANLHVAAGVGGGPYLEFPWDPPGWTEQRRDFFLAEPLKIDQAGCLRVPDASGLGAEIDEDAVAKLTWPS